MISPRTGLAGEAADFLEVGELGHLHPVEPHLPAETPRAQRRRFPVVLDEADVVLAKVDPECFQRAQVQVLDIVGRRFEHDLVLVVMLQPVRVLAVAAVLRSPRGLHVGRLPRLRANCTQECGRVEGSRAHLHVVGLEERATLLVPILLEAQDDLLEGEHCNVWQKAQRRDFTGRAVRAAKEPAPAREGITPAEEGDGVVLVGTGVLTGCRISQRGETQLRRREGRRRESARRHYPSVRKASSRCSPARRRAARPR